MSVDDTLARIDAIDRGKGWPAPLDLRELSRREPEPPAMIIDDWLPCGYATLLAGHGGAGKSSIALYLAVCTALGMPFFGLLTSPRRVMYLSCEDREDVLHWRLTRICQHLGISVADLHGRLDLIDLVGLSATLWERTPQGGATTAAFNHLLGALGGAEVLFVDGVADTFGGNENDRSDAKRFVNALVGLIPPDRGAVVLIHHVNKPAAGTSTSEGYSGSTGWHNSVRARWYLYPELEASEEGPSRTGRLILELQKSNLGRADQTMTFSWDQDAHLFVGELVGAPSAVELNERDQEEQDGIVAAILEVEAGDDYVPAAQQGPRTAHHVLATTESLPVSLKSKASRKRFWRHIEQLRRNGIVREGSKRRANRHMAATLTLNPANSLGSVNASYSSQMNATQSDADAPASNASYSTGGYRGSARAHCPRCDGEGCRSCEVRS